jgi:hypothetical protein
MTTQLQFGCPNFPLKQEKLHKNQMLLQMSRKKAIDDISSPLKNNSQDFELHLEGELNRCIS